MERLQRIGNALAVGVKLNNAGQAYAMLRGILVAFGTLFSLLGFSGLKPETIMWLIQLAQAVGGVIAALSAGVGFLLIVLPPIVESFKASPQERISDTSRIAQNPSLANSAAAQQALVTATSAVASTPGGVQQEAKQTILAAAIAMPEVQTIVADETIAQAAPSDDIVSREAVTIIGNNDGLEIPRNRNP